MAGLGQIVPQELNGLPVKNTFVHFPECAADAVVIKRRCQSEPPNNGRSLRSVPTSGATPRGNTDNRDECDSSCDVQRTYSGSDSTMFSGSDNHTGRSTVDSDSDSFDGDSAATAYHRETLVAHPPDAKGITAVCWTVEAERLGGVEHKVASPVFLLALPGWGWASFQILLYAHNKSQVLTFEQALGQGRVELKCLDTLPARFGNVAYNIKVGAKPPRGWVVHDFSRVLQRSERRVDFASSVDPCNRTLAVEVSFAPASLA